MPLPIFLRNNPLATLPRVASPDDRDRSRSVRLRWPPRPPHYFLKLILYLIDETLPIHMQSYNMNLLSEWYPQPTIADFIDVGALPIIEEIQHRLGAAPGTKVESRLGCGPRL